MNWEEALSRKAQTTSRDSIAISKITTGISGYVQPHKIKVSTLQRSHFFSWNEIWAQAVGEQIEMSKESKRGRLSCKSHVHLT